MSAHPLPARGLDYRTVWRWHFYAGLLCIPFVLWLAATGSVYLFKPQIEAWLDRSYDHLSTDGPRASPQAIATAALAAVPESVLNAYELPPTDAAAVRVLVGHGDRLVRVYVHPRTLAVLKVVDEDERPMHVVFRLHGELMLGDRGSMLVELAASWTILMLLSGLWLWWPRDRAGLGGVLYPRLAGGGGRRFWRDLHAVTGVWVSMFALFLLISGLPWAKSWGGMLKSVRSLGDAAVVRQDWTIGRSSELAGRRAANAAPAGGHEHHSGPADPSAPRDYAALDRLVPLVVAQGLAAPVLIAPPSRASASWNARSDTPNRPLRANLVLDGSRATVLERTGFDQRPLLDRIVGVGVAAHEGQLFGLANQLLGAFTAFGLVAVSLSAVVMWWTRRRRGVLGAPPAQAARRLSWPFLALVTTFAILLPLFGASLLAMLALERGVLRRSPRAAAFLGLRTAN